MGQIIYDVELLDGKKIRVEEDGSLVLIEERHIDISSLSVADAKKVLSNLVIKSRAA